MKESISGANAAMVGILAATLAGQWKGGTNISGVKFVGATPVKPVDQEYRDKRREKRKLTKLETMRKRGLLKE